MPFLLNLQSNPSPTGTTLAISANWLAYSPTLLSKDILAGCAPCAADLAEDGLFEVELPIAHMDEEIETLNGAFWTKMGRIFQAEGVTIRTVHGPIFSYDRFSVEIESERLKRYAEAALILGASALVVHPVFHSALHVCAVSRRALDRDVQLAAATSLVLEKSSCRLAIENVPHNSWSYLRELFDRLPPEVGMCFDTGHFWVRPEMSLEAALAHFASRIVCWHLSDNGGLCDAHQIPGTGNFPWTDWQLKATDAPCVIELSPPTISEDPEARSKTRELLREATAATKTLLRS